MDTTRHDAVQEAIEAGDDIVRRLRAAGLDERADDLAVDVAALRAQGRDGLARRYFRD